MVRTRRFLVGLIVTSITFGRRVFIRAILVALLALQCAVGAYQGVKLIVLGKFGWGPTWIRAMTASAIIADS